MLNKEIQSLRAELDKAILERKDYSEIYSLSIKLDELIARYYRENPEEKLETKVIGKENIKYKHINEFGSLTKKKEEVND